MNKKLVILLVAILCISIVCSGCGQSSDDNGDNGDGEQKNPVEQKTPEGDKGGTSAGKTDMVRINVFESGIIGLDTVEAEDKGTTVAAYAVKDYVDKVFEAAPNGSVTMIASDGYSISTDVGELMEDLVTLEGDTAPLSINSRAKYLQYIKTENESICFVADSLKVEDIFSALDMTEADNYRFVANDGFTMDVSKAEIAECTLIRKDESVDASIPALSGGDLREVLYIEAVQ